MASAERGQERIITTVFGGRSTASRNAKVAELMDLGFRRAPSQVAVVKPYKPYLGSNAKPVPKTIRVLRAVTRSPYPKPRPGSVNEAPEEMLVAMAETIEEAVTAAHVETASLVVNPLALIQPVLEPAAPPPKPSPATTKPAVVVEVAPTPTPRPEPVRLAKLAAPEPEEERIVVTRLSTSGGRLWGINVGRFKTRNEAERVLLKTALKELGTLDTALRKVASSTRGHDANFVGLTKEKAQLVCRRLQSRNIDCRTIGPT